VPRDLDQVVAAYQALEGTDERAIARAAQGERKDAARLVCRWRAERKLFLTRDNARLGGDWSVEDIQRALKAIGWPLAVDGVHGPETAAAVRAFQRGYLGLGATYTRRAEGRRAPGPAHQKRALRTCGRQETSKPTRADTLLAFATQQPAITMAAAATAMDVAPNGLHQVVRKLSGDGRLRKDGTGLFTTAEQTPADIEAEAPVEQAVPRGRQQQDEPVSDQDGGNGGQPDETAERRAPERAAESHNPQESTVSAAPDAQPSADESVEEQGGDDAPLDRPTRPARVRSGRRSRRMARKPARTALRPRPAT
jgi:peptidoglycan hydrolase-like protein with peptidoglycan-binding domain